MHIATRTWQLMQSISDRAILQVQVPVFEVQHTCFTHGLSSAFRQKLLY